MRVKIQFSRTPAADLVDLTDLTSCAHAVLDYLDADAPADDDERPDERHGHPWRLARTRRGGFLEFALQMDDAQFRENYRISRDMARIITQRCAPRFARCRLRFEHLLLCALVRVGHATTLRFMRDNCDISVGSLSTLTVDVWRAVAAEFWEEHVTVHAPNTPARRAAAAADFEKRHGIPFCTSISDGSGHQVPYPALATEMEKSSWRYYKSQTPCVRFMAAGDAMARFWQVRYGEPGNTPDSSYLRRMPFFQASGDLFPPPYYKATDGGLPLLRWLLTPFSRRDALVGVEAVFNRRFSAMRAKIEASTGAGAAACDGPRRMSRLHSA